MAHAPIGASHTAPPQLTKTSSRSFSVDPDCLSDLVDWLRSVGFRAVPTSRNAHEFARLRCGRELAVVYFTGSISCQGDDWNRLVKRLAVLAVERVDMFSEVKRPTLQPTLDGITAGYCDVCRCLCGEQDFIQPWFFLCETCFPKALARLGDDDQEVA